MDLRIFTEPQQGATYDQLLAVAQRTEDCGFDAFFRSDHYLAMGTDGLPGPTDAWVTLAGLARDTSTIRLGTMRRSMSIAVSTTRTPANTAETSASPPKPNLRKQTAATRQTPAAVQALLPARRSPGRGAWLRGWLRVSRVTSIWEELRGRRRPRERGRRRPRRL